MQDLTRGVVYGAAGTILAIALPIVLVLIGVKCLGVILKSGKIGGNGH